MAPGARKVLYAASLGWGAAGILVTLPECTEDATGVAGNTQVDSGAATEAEAAPDGIGGRDASSDGDAQPAACIDLDADPRNCGACGHDCLGGACLGGACQPVVLAANQLNPVALAIDDASVYWITSGSDGAVMRCALSGCGGNAEAYVIGQPNPNDIAVDDSFVYWSQSGAIHRATTRSGPVTSTFVQATIQTNYQALTVDGPDLFYIDQNGGTWEVGAAARADGGTRTIATPNNANGRALAASDGGIVWFAQGTSQPALYGCARDGTCTGSLWLEPVGDEGRLAIDSTHVYWTAPQSGELRRCATGGCTSADILAQGQPQPTSLAVRDDEVFFTSGADGGVLVLSCGATTGCGTRPKTLATVSGTPGGIAVDSNAVYWISGGDAGAILKVAR
jgi:hypothetical protein